MRSATLFDWFVAILLGLSFGLLVVCVGLWLEARYPNLPGASVPQEFYTVSTEFGFDSTMLDRVAFSHLEDLDASWPEATWMGTIGTTRPVLNGDDSTDQAFDLVFGPLLQYLGLPIIGRPLSRPATEYPLASTPIREAVLSRAFAVKLFGSPEGALGEFLQVGTFKWRLGVEDTADFQIVGVVMNEFRGVDIERPVDAWLGMNGWQGVLFPEQQVEVVRRRFGASTLAVLTDTPDEFGARLRRELDYLGEASAVIRLIPGAGYHPERRARFLAMSEAMYFGLQALSALLLVSVLAFGWMRNVRSAASDLVRTMLGEPERILNLRKLRSVISIFSIMLASIAALLCVALVTGGDSIPLRAAVYRGITEPWIGAGVLIVAGFLIAWPLWSRPTSVHSHANVVTQSTRPFTAFLAGLLSMTALLWVAGSLSVQRAYQLLDPPLPHGVRDTSIQKLVSDDRRWVFDRRSTNAFESDLSRLGVALATAGPVGGGVIGQRATIRSEAADRNAVVHVNHVSANYFQVLGLSIQNACGPFSDLPAGSVIANRKFLADYGAGADPGALRIVMAGDDEMRVCGVVDDAHINDARAGLASVLYSRLAERRDMKSIVYGDSPTMALRQDVLQRIKSHFPAADVGPAEKVSDILSRQLEQERHLIWLNATIMGAAGVVSWVTAWMLVRVVIELNLRNLAIRRAVGCSMGRLAGIAVFGNRALPWVGAATLTSLGVFGISRGIGAAAFELAIPALATALAVTALALLTWLRVPVELGDCRLWASLNRE